MAENLNYAASGKCANNSDANCAKYGRLYDWATAMNLPSSCNSSSCASQVSAKHRGICPSDWHIPSYADWNVLMKFVSGCSDNMRCDGAGTKLKATSGWFNNDNYKGLDMYGFSALPGGRGYSDGSFDNVGTGIGLWWSASEFNSNSAYDWYMFYGADFVIRTYNDKSTLFSVRCLQD